MLRIIHRGNDDETISSVSRALKRLDRKKLWLLEIKKYSKKRSVELNAVLHGWFSQISQALGQDDVGAIKAECKLLYGVPILRAESESFRKTYDRCIKPLPYEKKLEAMRIVECTSLMSSSQLMQMMLAMQKHYDGNGVTLDFPQ